MCSPSNTGSIHWTQRIRNECNKIKDNADLLHRVHKHFAKRIRIFSNNDKNHIKDVIWIKIKGCTYLCKPYFCLIANAYRMLVIVH